MRGFIRPRIAAARAGARISHGMLIGDAVAAFIEREHLLTAGQRVVAGVSGGPDSLCLLDCLDRLGFPVLVAHLDHGLRPHSWRDAEFVLRMARARGLPAIVERVGPPGLRRRGVSVEEAGRLARYRFLVRVAREAGAQVVATGHTADDQAETILMHFLRGAGVHGLRGMLPRTPLGEWASLEAAQGITLIRPLLESSRSQTEAHCRAAGLRPHRDATNEDTTYFRNRLRHKLLPALEGYNPKIRQALRRTGDVMRREAELLDEVLTAVEPSVFAPGAAGAIAIRRAALLAQPIGLQRALLGRGALRLAPGVRDFGYEAVELARARLGQRAVGRRTALPGGLELLDQGDIVLLVARGAELQYPGFPQLVTHEAVLIQPPAQVRLRSGLLIVSPEVEPPPLATGPRVPGLTEAVWLDRAQLARQLSVRPPRPGDRMRPLGMDGHRKLADIFNSLRVPAGARRNWPVVLSGDDIVWLAGLRMGHEARLTPQTRTAVQLRVELTERASE